MQLFDIIEVIEKIAPRPLASDWDKSGVQVAGADKKIKNMAVMLDPTLESIRKAVSGGAEFILAHHPLSMKPRFPDATGVYHDILSLLFRNDICLYSAHTSLDANPRGPARWLAAALGMTGCTVLEPTGLMEGNPTGFGFVGDLPAELGYGEFCKNLATALERDNWRACGHKPAKVRRVACCPGSGGDMTPEAAAAGAQVYITGDMKYHAALEAADLGIRVLDVGHFQIEEIMMRCFAEQLSGDLTGVTVRFLHSSDPLVFEKH